MLRVREVYVEGGSNLTASKISVIMPAYNEVENIDGCINGVVEALSKNGEPFEIIVVDDGSTDGTPERVRKLLETEDKVLLVGHPHNMGKTEAIKSGLARASGNIIVLMDADQQYDPNDIPRLVHSIGRGYDAVNGRREKRKDSFTKTLPSKAFNRIASAAFGLDVKDFNSGLKAFRREVLEKSDLKGDYHRYVLAIAKGNGYRVSEIPISHYPRKYGKSKYGFGRLILGSLDLLTLKAEMSLSKRPMLLFGTLFMICFILGLAGGIYSIVTGGITLRPALLLGIGLIIASIQFLAIGFLAGLINDTKEEVRRFRGKKLMPNAV
jgi:glycosyltransferase involved in cell wall biosynthesis